MPSAASLLPLACDSVSQTSARLNNVEWVKIGSKVISSGANILFTKDEIKSLLGRDFSFSHDLILAMNGDSYAVPNNVLGASYNTENGNIYVEGTGGILPFRVIYLVVKGS